MNASFYEYYHLDPYKSKFHSLLMKQNMAWILVIFNLCGNTNLKAISTHNYLVSRNLTELILVGLSKEILFWFAK
jgi:hypothetical protein